MTASPDLRELIDLRPYDLDPWDIQQRALQSVSDALAGNYEPLTGDPDVVLIGGLAREVMDLVVAANRAPYASMQGILNAFGVPWFEGARAITTMLFTGTPGVVIPIGVEAQVILSSGEAMLFRTTASGTISGGGTVEVAAECTARTSLANRINEGTLLSLATGSVSITSVAIGNPVVGGLDPETIIDYYTRVGNRLDRITDALVGPDTFKLAALENPGVIRATGIPEWDGVSPSTVGDDFGHMTVALAGPNGVPLSVDLKATIKTDLMARAITALAVHLVDATVVPITIVATVRADRDANLVDVHTSAVAALQAFLSPDTSDWGRTIEPNDIVEVLGRDVAGADVVIGSIVPTTAIVLGPNELPIYNVASTITVVAP